VREESVRGRIACRELFRHRARSHPSFGRRTSRKSTLNIRQTPLGAMRSLTCRSRKIPSRLLLFLSIFKSEEINDE